MKKILKTLAIMLILVPCAIILAACGGGDGPTGSGDTTANMYFKTSMEIEIDTQLVTVGLAYYQDQNSQMIELMMAGQGEDETVYMVVLLHNDESYFGTNETGAINLTEDDWSYTGPVTANNYLFDPAAIFAEIASALSYEAMTEQLVTAAAEEGSTVTFENKGKVTVAGNSAYKMAVITETQEGQKTTTQYIYVTQDGYILGIDTLKENGEIENSAAFSTFKLNPRLSDYVNVNKLPEATIGE